MHYMWFFLSNHLYRQQWQKQVTKKYFDKKRLKFPDERKQHSVRYHVQNHVNYVDFTFSM